MTKKQLLLILALVVVLAAAGTAFYYYRHKKAAAADPLPKAPDDDIISKIGDDDSPVMGSAVALSAANLLAPGLPASLVQTTATTDVAQVGNIGVIQEEVSAGVDGLGGVSAVKAAPVTSVFPLRYGSTGPEVADLQSYLVREYGVAYPSGITSAFDGATQAAVRKHLKRDTISHQLFNKLRRSLARH